MCLLAQRSAAKRRDCREPRAPFFLIPSCSRPSSRGKRSYWSTRHLLEPRYLWGSTCCRHRATRSVSTDHGRRVACCTDLWSPSAWTGVQFVHKGYWAGSVLRFTLAIPSNYPAAAPRVTYEAASTIVHPLIDPATGLLRLDGRFPSWRPRQDFIFHVLHYLKACFKRRELDMVREATCANKEAYRM